MREGYLIKKRSYIFLCIVIVLAVILSGCSKNDIGTDTGEDLVLKDLEVLSETELQATFDSDKTVKITQFSPKPLPLGEKTEVTFNYEGITYSKEITYVITISGKISSQQANTISASTFNKENIAKVILFFGSEYKISQVENGTFHVTIDREQPGGIVFLDSINNYMGYLSLTEGLDTFPTQAISEETGEINLGEIQFTEEGMGIPSNDPFANFINSEEKSMMVTAQSFFGAVIRSPELIEVLVEKEDLNFNISLAYNIDNIPVYEKQNNIITYNNCFGKAHPDYPDENYPLIGGHRLGMTINLGVLPENVSIDYPDIIEDVTPRLNYSSKNDYSFIGVGREGEMDENSPVGSPIPKAGNYFFNIGTKEFTLMIPELAEPTEENLVFVTPTFHLIENENNIKIIEKITWTYRTKAGNEVENPEKIIGKIKDNANIHIGLQIDDKNGDPIAGYVEEAFLGLSKREYILEKEIAWDNPDGKEFRNVNMSYEDIYGIEYTVPFSKFD